MSQIAAAPARVQSLPDIPRFHLGRVLMTRGVNALVQSGRFDPATLLRKHVCGDWGDLCDDDKAINDRSVNNGGRLMSSYRVEDGLTIWIVTEAGRSVTTLLLPSEY